MTRNTVLGLLGIGQHVRRLWPGAGILLPLPFVAWGAAWLAAGQGRVEHLLIMIGVPLLAFLNARGKRLFLGLLPMGLLGLVYDSTRLIKNVGLTPERVHVCDLRALDMRIAGVSLAGERGTVHDWVQAHPSPTLDLICAIPYGTFIFVIVGFAVFLYVKDYARMRLFGWAFLVLNIAGFATYHLYPAAPPWYFHEHGCTVDLNALPSEGANLARVDALLGIHYFRDFYGRAAEVYGAVPSLHVAYPLLIVLFGWPTLRWPGRAFAITFLLAMCTAAVWLDHHWIVDIFIGLAYTLGVYALFATYERSRPLTIEATS
jgi:inositol phosphorylceramide synthase catalytic subunit